VKRPWRAPPCRELLSSYDLRGYPQRQGTYVVRALVYAYAMWISPIFHLKVIRSFDAGMRGGAAQADTLPEDVRAAINRRAHALSLRRYDRIREDLAEALRRHLKRYPEDRDLVAYVAGVDPPDSALITLHRSDLSEITSRFAAIEAALALVDAAAVGNVQDVRTWSIWEPLQPHVGVLVDAAEAAGIAKPTGRLLNDLGLFLATKAQHAEAEPLYRRALAIDEASFGPEHPDVAHDLNNLARLLEDTNRLGEAEPLMRRVLVIFLLFFRQTGYSHPYLAAAFTNYRGLLEALSLDNDEVQQRMGSLGREAALGEEEYRRLLDDL